MADRYYCSVCGYVYDPEKGEARRGVSPGTSFDDLPASFRCPSCGAGIRRFRLK